LLHIIPLGEIELNAVV